MLRTHRGYIRPYSWPKQIAGIYCDQQGFVMVLINLRRRVSDISVYMSSFQASAELSIIAEDLVKRRYSRNLPIHVVSNSFEILPLLLPAAVSEAEAIACAELKLQQQSNPSDWLWDITLAEQNSKLWLLARSQYAALVSCLNTLNFTQRQLCSWRPASDLAAERKLAEQKLKEIKPAELKPVELAPTELTSKDIALTDLTLTNRELHECFLDDSHENHSKLVLATAALLAKYPHIQRAEFCVAPAMPGACDG